MEILYIHRVDSVKRCKCGYGYYCVPLSMLLRRKRHGITKLTQLLLYSDYQICMLFYYNQLDSGLQIGNFCKMILLNALYASLNYLHRY